MKESILSVSKPKADQSRISEAAGTPLMQQYRQIQSQHPGALLLFRVGDFYEMFGKDAVLASRILDIVLTKRSNGAAASVDLAGFPHHALEIYLPKLVKAGYRVAVCDQLEDPKQAKGIVKRGVTELVTPGLAFNDHVLSQQHNNYLGSLYYSAHEVGVAFLDVSTGEFLTAQGSISYVLQLIQNFQPSEIICSKSQQQTVREWMPHQTCSHHALENWVYRPDYAHTTLQAHFGTLSLKGFGIEKLPEGIVAAGAVLRYLQENQYTHLQHITRLTRIEEKEYVWLDAFTARSLELLQPQHEAGVALITVLDKTLTPMGSRLMKKRLALPLRKIEAIQQRLDVVEALVETPEVLDTLRTLLEPVGDVERLISKIVARRANPKEVWVLHRTLQQIKPLKASLQESQQAALDRLSDGLDPCSAVAEMISCTLQEDPPALTHQGGLIRDGIDPELDELRRLARDGRDHLVQIQQEERQRTGISSLKVGYNKVFGYYLEVTDTHKAKVPTAWIRKQTLTHAERYVTQELKEYEEKILNAQEKIVAVEQRRYQELLDRIAAHVARVQQNSHMLAQIDCYLSLAQTARSNHYTRPVLSDEHVIDIRDGRHPVIEAELSPDACYVPSDVRLDDHTQQILIITGPNMAGKSALLRQTALIVLMAQMGSFVPASHARIGAVDKVFTRVGASDNLAKGESTFMVEMTETASILHNLSPRSLILMDEIGRGTSTYDGLSIAWSIVEYLHNHPTLRVKTLFATHYHELSQIAAQLSGVQNFRISVAETEENVLFLRKLEPGSSARSFGIHVARIAGMPAEVVARATVLLQQWEGVKNSKSAQTTPTTSTLGTHSQPDDPGTLRVRAALEEMDPNHMTPVQALHALIELKELSRSALQPVS